MIRVSKIGFSHFTKPYNWISYRASLNVIPWGFQNENWFETLFNSHIFKIPAQHWLICGIMRFDMGIPIAGTYFNSHLGDALTLGMPLSMPLCSNVRSYTYCSYFIKTKIYHTYIKYFEGIQWHFQGLLKLRKFHPRSSLITCLCQGS